MALPTPAPGILPEPTEVNILTSAEALPASVASYDRWRTGLTQREMLGVAGGSWPVDCVTDDEKVAIAEAGEPSVFVPVAHYIHHGCEGRVDAEAYKAEALAILDQSTPYLLANELWTGATTGNPSLQSTGYDLTPFVASGLSPAEVIGILIGAFETNTRGAKAYIHVPQASLPELILNQYVVRQGNRLVTTNGHVVISGPGYPANGNNGPSGSPEANVGEGYIYVTGRVEVATHTSFTIGTEDNSVGGYARQNLVEFYAERQAIYRFPTTPVFAMLADADWYTPPT